MIFGIFDAISFFTEVRRQYLNCITMAILTFPFLKKRDHFFLRFIAAFFSVFLVAVALMFLNLTSFVNLQFSAIVIYGFSVVAEFLIFWMKLIKVMMWYVPVIRNENNSHCFDVWVRG